MIAFVIAAVLLTLFFIWFKKRNKVTSSSISTPAPEKWKKILIKKVNFYRNLNDDQKLRFESDVQRFLEDTPITGVQTEVTIEDRLLVASSAVIPLFGFPAWNYQNLNEVLLYPSAFDRNYNIDNNSEIITGMVGSGAMEGKMILSKPALHAGLPMPKRH